MTFGKGGRSEGWGRSVRRKNDHGDLVRGNKRKGAWGNSRELNRSRFKDSVVEKERGSLGTGSLSPLKNRKK